MVGKSVLVYFKVKTFETLMTPLCRMVRQMHMNKFPIQLLVRQQFHPGSNIVLWCSPKQKQAISFTLNSKPSNTHLPCGIYDGIARDRGEQNSIYKLFHKKKSGIWLESALCNVAAFIGVNGRSYWLVNVAFEESKSSLWLCDRQTFWGTSTLIRNEPAAFEL